MGVALSICIPTYNFGPFIGATLDSILSQCVDGVEVVILDSGSTDDTAQIVTARAANRPWVRYHRAPERGGIDRDMDRVAGLAGGEYLWLFSADDIMYAGAVAEVLQAIRSGQDVYLCGMTLATFDLRAIGPQPILAAPDGAEFDLGDNASRRRYFAAARTTTAFFSFMGSLIVKRARWRERTLNEKYVGSLWAHVVRIFEMIPAGLRVKYLARQLLLKRGGNDSFMDRGLVRRFAVAIDGYHRIAAELFGADSIEAFHIRRVVANEYPLKVMLAAKLSCRGGVGADDLAMLDGLARKVYVDRSGRNRLNGFIYRYAPLRVYGWMRAGYRFVRTLLRRPFV